MVRRDTSKGRDRTGHARARVGVLVGALLIGTAGLTAPTTVHAQEACDPGGGNRKATATFVNTSAARVQVYWVDYDCVERLYHTLSAGAQYRQPTFVSQLWRVRDENGNLVGEVRIRPGKSGRAPAPTIRIG